MTRVFRLFLIAVLAVPLSGTVGCNSKEEGKPNPELGPPPDVPPGRGAAEDSKAVEPPKGKK